MTHDLAAVVFGDVVLQVLVWITSGLEFGAGMSGAVVYCNCDSIARLSMLVWFSFRVHLASVVALFLGTRDWLESDREGSLRGYDHTVPRGRSSSGTLEVLSYEEGIR